MTNAEIQVGEYVRTMNGNIFKLKEFFKEGSIYSMVDEKGLLCGNPRKVIKKHSPNIIDLIEVGDYVNGEEITYINKKGILTSDNYELDMFEDLTRKEFTNEDIKSVVTKEQFKSMEYEVGKDD